jgi:metal-responsive CopG/Arc/MetJ family transcriptional regulator
LKPTSITLDEELRKKLADEMAQRNLDNISQTIRLILREYFKSKQG